MNQHEQGYDPYNKSKAESEQKPLEQVAMDPTHSYLDDLREDEKRRELLRKLEEEERERIEKRKKNS